MGDGFFPSMIATSGELSYLIQKKRDPQVAPPLHRERKRQAVTFEPDNIKYILAVVIAI